ncbi:MAG: sll1863 family stress response protein [Gaiellaceae bacterium]
MARKDEYVAKLEAQIEDWSARIDGLTAKTHKLTDDARRSVQKQIEEGKVKLAAARQKVDALKTVGSDKYEEAKTTLESFWKDAKAVFEKN